MDKKKTEFSEKDLEIVELPQREAMGKSLIGIKIKFSGARLWNKLW